jgi:hypothetical protein
MMSIKPISGSQICGQSHNNPNGMKADDQSLQTIFSVSEISSTSLSLPAKRRKLPPSCTECEKLKVSLKEFFPAHPNEKSAIQSSITGSLRSTNEFKRQLNFLDKAEAGGHTVIRGDVDSEKRRLGVSLVIMKAGVKGNEGGLMDEEIFGPVLPIIPVDVSCPIFALGTS